MPASFKSPRWIMSSTPCTELGCMGLRMLRFSAWTQCSWKEEQTPLRHPPHGHCLFTFSKVSHFATQLLPGSLPPFQATKHLATHQVRLAGVCGLGGRGRGQLGLGLSLDHGQRSLIGVQAGCSGSLTDCWNSCMQVKDFSLYNTMLQIEM